MNHYYAPWRSKMCDRRHLNSAPVRQSRKLFDDLRLPSQIGRLRGDVSGSITLVPPFAGVALLFAAIALLAALILARRATNGDPLTALRFE